MQALAELCRNCRPRMQSGAYRLSSKSRTGATGKFGSYSERTLTMQPSSSLQRILVVGMLTLPGASLLETHQGVLARTRCRPTDQVQMGRQLARAQTGHQGTLQWLHAVDCSELTL